MCGFFYCLISIIMNMNLVSDKVGRITTVDKLLEAAEVDVRLREVFKQKVNKWEVAMNKKDWSTELTELFQVTAELKPLSWLSHNHIMDIFKNLLDKDIPVIEHNITANDSPLLAQIGHFDLHIDRLEHWKKKYLQEIDDRTMRLFETLLKEGPSKLIYVNGGDYFNTDGNGWKTTKGTPQFNYLTEQEAFRVGLEHQAKLINTFASELPVEAIYIAGNHDVYRAQTLADSMDLLFSKTDNVEVDAEPLARKYRKRGSTTIWYWHGDGIKDKQIFPTMQNEAKLGKHNYYLRWHTHQRMSEEKWELQIDTYPSPAHPSEWERNMWRTTRWGIYGQLFDKKDGKIAEFKK